MNDIDVDFESVEALDALVSSLCPTKAKWSGIMGQRMDLVSQDSACLDLICFDGTGGAKIADPAEAYLLRCMEAFQKFMQEERCERIRFAASNAIHYIEDGILTVAEVKTAVQDLADRREELALGGVHPIDLVSDAEVESFGAFLDENLREELTEAPVYASV